MIRRIQRLDAQRLSQAIAEAGDSVVGLESYARLYQAKSSYQLCPQFQNLEQRKFAKLTNTDLGELIFAQNWHATVDALKKGTSQASQVALSQAGTYVARISCRKKRGRRKMRTSTGVIQRAHTKYARCLRLDWYYTWLIAHGLAFHPITACFHTNELRVDSGYVQETLDRINEKRSKISTATKREAYNTEHWTLRCHKAYGRGLITNERLAPSPKKVEFTVFIKIFSMLFTFFCWNCQSESLQKRKSKVARRMQMANSEASQATSDLRKRPNMLRPRPEYWAADDHRIVGCIRDAVRTVQHFLHDHLHDPHYSDVWAHSEKALTRLPAPPDNKPRIRHLELVGSFDGSGKVDRTLMTMYFTGYINGLQQQKDLCFVIADIEASDKSILCKRIINGPVFDMIQDVIDTPMEFKLTDGTWVRFIFHYETTVDLKAQMTDGGISEQGKYGIHAFCWYNPVTGERPWWEPTQDMTPETFGPANAYTHSAKWANINADIKNIRSILRGRTDDDSDDDSDDVPIIQQLPTMLLVERAVHELLIAQVFDPEIVNRPQLLEAVDYVWTLSHQFIFLKELQTQTSMQGAQNPVFRRMIMQFANDFYDIDDHGKERRQHLETFLVEQCMFMNSAAN